MQRLIPLVACLLLAFIFFIHPARADENEVWWASARAEAERDGYKLIDCKALNQLIEAGGDMLVIDARADYEFAAGHIPGAVNMEFDLGDRMGLPDEKRKAFEELAGPDRRRRIVVYCRSFR